MVVLADENVDAPIVDRLRADGHIVIWVAEMEPGIPDDLVLERANENSALLLTADKDFGELVFRQRLVNYGVVLFRLTGLSGDSKATAVSIAFSRHADEMSGCFTVISPGR